MSGHLPGVRAGDPFQAEQLKRRAAEGAIEGISDGMVLGLGTGSTVAHLLDLLGARIGSGELRDVRGVPTSAWTEAQAKRLGIPLTTLADHARLDLTVDGADEIGPGLDLIKGMGGALLREKIVAQCSERVLVIADESKRVDRLGTVSPLPVEVVPWGHEAQIRRLSALGGRIEVRLDRHGRPFRTDNGNYVLHCRFDDGIAHPEGLEQVIRSHAGVVESGLFLGIADEALIASADGVARVSRKRGP